MKECKPKGFKIHPIKQQMEYYKPPRELPEPFNQLTDKGGGVCLVLGPPGSGKSVYVNNLILSDECMRDIFHGGTYGISPTINDDLSSVYLKEYLDFIEDEYSEPLMKGIVKNIQSCPPEDRHLSLILLDDCLDAFKGHRDYIGKATSICRHLKTIFIFSLQRLKGVPASMRANTTLAVIYYIPSDKELKAVAEYCSFLGGERNFLEKYKQATSVRYGCLLCDFRGFKMYRHGADLNQPELIWQMYLDSGEAANGKLDLNPGQIKGD